jgi:hypothetical protein
LIIAAPARQQRLQLEHAASSLELSQDIARRNAEQDAALWDAAGNYERDAKLWGLPGPSPPDEVA